MSRLEGKVCVITGAASGIGAETAALFRSEGAKVVGVDLRDDSPGVDLALACDVADDEAVRSMYARAHETFGRLDVLFNNAGISPNDDASVLDTSLEAWQRVQDVNTKSVFLCCKHGIPYLLKNGGSVINTASFVAVMGAATSQISYTASKGAVLALSRELGVEFGRAGVRVNALCPGPVNTPLLQELFAKDPEKAARRLVHLPMGRFAEAREIANAALFLASDESSYITASTFLVDGGLSGAYVTPRVGRAHHPGARGARLLAPRSRTGKDSAVETAQARDIAERLLHGALLSETARRAAATSPEARVIAWLHPLFERGAVSEQELLAAGLTADQLRALRLLTRPAGARFHRELIASASGRSGRLARAVLLVAQEDWGPAL